MKQEKQSVAANEQLAPRCCSPGTTGIAGRCRGGRRRASGPIRTGSGCRKSCCSRPASRRSGRISRNSWRAGRMSRRSAAPRSTTCCGCGPGSAIIRGRATCTPARSRCCAIMAASFPDTEEGLRALPGIGPYTAAAIAAIAFDRRTMPVDGNIERVVSRLFTRRGAAAAGEAADPGVGGDVAGVPPGDEVSRRRQRAGADGSRLLDLHAEEAGLRAVPAERRLRRARARRSGDRFRARRRRRPARCGGARPSSSHAATSSWSAPGPKRACSAA